MCGSRWCSQPVRPGGQRQHRLEPHACPSQVWIIADAIERVEPGDFRTPDGHCMAHADRRRSPRGVAQAGNENAQPSEVGHCMVVGFVGIEPTARGLSPDAKPAGAVQWWAVFQSN